MFGSWLPILLAPLFLCWGSFLNVIAHRLIYDGNLLDKSADVNAGKRVSEVAGGPASLHSPWDEAKDEMDRAESDTEKEKYKEVLMVLEKAGGHSTK